MSQKIAFENNDLVNVYDTAGSPRKTLDVCLEDEMYFKGGVAIGSPFFQYQIMKKLKGG